MPTLLTYILLDESMTQQVALSDTDMSVISQHGWNGVFSVILQHQQEVQNPEIKIPRDIIKNPEGMDSFNDGIIDNITDELGSFRKGADRVYRANVSKNSMHIRAYEDEGIYTAEIDAYNPSEGIPEAVNHITEDIVA